MNNNALRGAAQWTNRTDSRVQFTALAALGAIFTAGAIFTTQVAWAANAPGSIVYVTDELRLGLYRTEETSGRSQKTLVSGSRLEVLERSLMSIRVRTEEGDEGWVKTAYIVEAEPARRRLAALEQLQAETAASLAASQASATELQDQVRALSASLSEAKQGIEELPAIAAENVALKQALEARGMRVDIVWLIAAALASLAAGLYLGYWWLDRRVRSKFGGVRVY